MYSLVQHLIMVLPPMETILREPMKTEYTRCGCPDVKMKIDAAKIRWPEGGCQWRIYVKKNYVNP